MEKTLYQGVGAVAVNGCCGWLWMALGGSEWLREIIHVGKSVIDPY